MKLKASVDYGVRAIMYLAVHDGTCSSREISEEMAIPRDYLIQLALKLRNAGLITAKPGKNGGYLLAKKASKITLGEILDAFDSDLKHARQAMKTSRQSSPSAEKVRQMHAMVLDSLDSYMNAITVQSLIDAMDQEKGARIPIAEALEAEATRLRK